MPRITLRYLSALLFLVSPVMAEPLEFRGAPSREVLEGYLSRAVTHAGLLASSADPTTDCFEDDLRMLTSLGAKFVGRAAFVWDLAPDDEAHFAKVEAAARRVHAADPEMVLQAAIFEIVAADVRFIRVPDAALKAFGIEADSGRMFSYEAMLYDKGAQRDRWRPGASVPDISKLETRLWFYSRACRYIDAGIEALHFGQVKLMDDADPDHAHWDKLLAMIRTYAGKHARRAWVFCDAHTHGIARGKRLLFDFNSYPLRIRQRTGSPQETYLASDDADDLIGRSLGGTHPAGWSCESAPYLLELDNYGFSGRGGSDVGGIWVWGYDEISWFAHQSPDYRDTWLRYAFKWIENNAPGGFLQMPTRRMLAAPVDGVAMFHANDRCDACPKGFGLEGTIRNLWGLAE